MSLSNYVNDCPLCGVMSSMIHHTERDCIRDLRIRIKEIETTEGLDMTFQELVKKLKEGDGYDQEALDELVHKVASELASNANNNGLEAQLAFLLEYGHFEIDEIPEWVEK